MTSGDGPITGDPGRWPHLEACYALALIAAKGFAPPAHVDGAFTAARWGLHLGMTLARLAPEWAAAVNDELDDYDITRDGLEAMTHARFAMLRDVEELERMARGFAEDGTT